MNNIQNTVQEQILDKSANKNISELSEIAIIIAKEYIHKVFPFSFDDEKKEMQQAKKPIADEDELDNFYHQLDRSIDNHHIQITSLTVTSKMIMVNIKLISTEEYYHLQIKKENNNFIYFFEYLEERLRTEILFKHLF